MFIKNKNKNINKNNYSNILFLMSLSLFGLCFVPITITNASHVTMNKCDSNSYDSCVNNWECMWCNYSTIENNTIVHKENCNYLNPCYLNEDNNENCLFKNQDKYKLQCKIASLLFYLLLSIGYYISLIVIYGTLNRLIINENISLNAKRSLNSMILILTLAPLIVSFFTNVIVFNFIFVSYILSAILISCCIKVSDREMLELNLNKNSNTKSSYDQIN